jgi:hypothetical protein
MRESGWLLDEAEIARVVMAVALLFDEDLATNLVADSP